MKAKLAALVLFALAPLVAFAESEYTACLKAHGRARPLLLMPTRGDLSSFNNTSGVYYDGYHSYPISGYYSYGGVDFGGLSGRSAAMNSWFWGGNDAVLAMAKACRHLIKVQRPAYRIIAVKSPALRTAINVPSRKEPAKPQ